MHTVVPTVSVIIPTRNRPDRLAQCLGALQSQDGAIGEFEVLVALDGPDKASADVAARFESSGLCLHVIQCPRLGNALAKNIALDAAEGELIVLLNDDVTPAPEFLRSHAETHASRGARPALVVGWSPWVIERPDRLFDRLLRETSMVFFYDRMVTPDGRAKAPPDHDWGFRHAWTLNLSFRRDHAADVGWFDPRLANCCFEDVEFGYRFTRTLGAPVLFRAGAVAPHRHRYDPSGYLEREFRLGYSAYTLARVSPACSAEVFGADLVSPEYLAYCREYVSRESRDEPSARAAFESLADVPADAVAAPHAEVLLRLLHAQHTPLKRLAFRRGLLAAASGERIEGLFGVEDGALFELGTRPPGTHASAPPAGRRG